MTWIGILTLLVVAAGMALWVRGLLARRTRLQAFPPRDPSWTRVVSRLDGLFTLGFGQKRMFRDVIPGLMHAILFWGVLVLALRAVSLVGAAVVADAERGLDVTWSVFAGVPGLHHVFTVVKDAAGFLVLLMVLLSLYRRFVIRPDRHQPSRGSLWVLLALAAFVVADLVLEGVAGILTAADAPPQATLVGGLVGGLVGSLLHAGGLTLGTAASVLFYAAYATAVVAFLAFLNLTLHPDNGHMVNALSNIFRRNVEPGTPPRPVPNLATEIAGETPQIGLAAPRDLSRKQALDLLACMECGRCSERCPAVLAQTSLDPRALLATLRGALETAPSSLPAAVGPEAIWACTTCRACDDRCPVAVECVDKVIDLRRNLALVQRAVPEGAATVLGHLEATGNPWGHPREARATWCEGLDVPILSELDDSDRAATKVLFFVGCAGAYDPNAQRTARAIVTLLKAASVPFAILGNEEGCTGDVARRLGREDLFVAQAAHNVALFQRYGVKTILTMCPHCLQTLGNEYDALGKDFEVIHHTEFLADLLADGKLKPAGSTKARVVYHDPCYLSRYNGVNDDPREIIEAAPGARLCEARANRENTSCCGSGGGHAWSAPAAAATMADRRVADLRAARADVIATACPFCASALAAGVARSDEANPVAVVDVAEVLAARLTPGA